MLLYRIFLCLIFFPGAFHLSAQKTVLTQQKQGTVKIKGQTFSTLNAIIQVPESWSNPGGRTLDLPVFVIKSPNSEAAEPVFYLRGGPGSSNITSTQNTELLQLHDYVFIGYRGADGSTLLKAPAIGKAMKGKNHNLLSDASMDNIEARTREYLADLEKQGVNICDYNMMNVIEDLEAARKALGYGRINLHSVSYGTRVALLYSWKYPEVIQRSVMVGANPPGYFIWYPEKTEEILAIYDSLYLAQKSPRYPGGIRKAMKLALDQMPKRWTFYRLDAGKIKVISFSMLYQRETALQMFDAYFKAAYKKDYSGLYLMQLAYDKLVPKSSIWGDLFAKAVTADRDSSVNYRKQLQGAETTLGGNYSLLAWGSAGGMPTCLIPAEYRKVQRSQTPTLILSGDLDVSTPADFSKNELMPYLPQGQQLILKNMSHSDLVNRQPEAYRKLICDYMDSGKVNEAVFTPEVVDFKKKRKKFTAMAKWLFPVIVILNIF